MLPSLFFSLISATANAGTPDLAYYSSNEVAKNSTLFAKAAEVSAPQYSQAEQNIRKYSKTLSEMEFNTAFLQDDGLSQWFSYNQKRIIGYRLQVSRHVSLMTEDYDKEFSSAVERAIESIAFEGTVKKCEGNKMQAMMGSAPKCDGKSLDKDISNIIDNDQELKTALDEINALKWPESQVEEKEQSVTPITGTEYYIDLYVFSTKFLQESIDSHGNWLEAQTDSIIEGLESGDSDSIKQAEAFRKAYNKRIAADGKKLISTFEVYANKRVKKNDKLGTVGFCGNVKALGGCTGQDATAEMMEFLANDKKFLKSLTKAGF